MSGDAFYSNAIQRLEPWSVKYLDHTQPKTPPTVAQNGNPKAKLIISNDLTDPSPPVKMPGWRSISPVETAIINAPKAAPAMTYCCRDIHKS